MNPGDGRQVMARPKLAENMRMTLEELLALPVAVDLETAGRAHGLGRTSSYERVRAGEFPCKVRRLGRYYRVAKADLMTSLGLGMDGKPLGDHAAGDAA